MSISDAICMQSWEDDDKEFRFEMKRQQSSGVSEKNNDTPLNRRTEAEYDISNLFELLNTLSFPKYILKDDVSESETILNKALNKSLQFEFTIPSNRNYEKEIKRQNKFFERSKFLIETRCWNNDWLIHAKFNMKAVIINEILLTLSNLIDYEEGYNQFSDFTQVPDETVYTICNYLKDVWSNPEYLDESGPSTLAEYIQNIVSSVSSKKDEIFKILDFKTETDNLSKAPEENKESSVASPILDILNSQPDDNSPQKNDSSSISSIQKSDEEIYAEIINSLACLDTSWAQAKEDLSLILKSLNKEIYQKVSSKINPNHIVNKLVSKVAKEQHKNYEKKLFGK